MIKTRLFKFSYRDQGEDAMNEWFSENDINIITVTQSGTLGDSVMISIFYTEKEKQSNKEIL